MEKLVLMFWFPRATNAILISVFILASSLATAQNTAEYRPVEVWKKKYGGTYSDYIRNILKTSDGGYLLGGISYSDLGGDKTENSYGSGDFWVVKIDSIGAKQWDKTFGGSGDESLKQLLETSDGYLLCGDSYSPADGSKTQSHKGRGDFWVVKTDFSGTKIWDKAFGGNRDDRLSAAVNTPDGAFIIGGSSNSFRNDNKIGGPTNK